MGRPWKQDKSLVGKTKDCECGCGEQILILSEKGHRYRKFKRGHVPKGKNNASWKGGRHTNLMGYILVYSPDHPFATHDGYVYEHRLVWEKHNKAMLLRKTVIHHRNGIKSDNRIENLEPIINNGLHTSEHNTKDMSHRICHLCKRITGTTNRIGRPLWYGSEDKWVCNACYCKSKYHSKILSPNC